MTLVVETGTGSPASESYASVADGAARAAKFGLTWPADTTAAEQALRRATRYIDATYRTRFIGRRLKGRDQALEWPRDGAFVTVDGPDNYAHYGYYGGAALVQLPSTAIPPELIAATIEAAVLEASTPGGLVETVPQGVVKKVTVGDVGTEFFEPKSTLVGGTSRLEALNLDAILAVLLSAYSGYTARVSRA